MIIYKTTNLINGKIYIGQYSGKRKSYLGSGIILKQAVKKYGKENFKRDTLEVCCSRKQLNDREIYWINFFKSTIPNIGYNIGKGGEGFDTSLIGFVKVYGRDLGEQKYLQWKKKCSDSKKGRATWNKGKSGVYSNKSRKKISISLKKYWKSKENRTFTPEHKENMSKSMMGVKKGPLTEEHKIKLRLANLGKKRTETQKKKSSESQKKTYKNGRVPSMKGKKHPEEAKRKMSIAKKQYWEKKKNEQLEG